MSSWHENDSFWDAMSPVLFTPEIINAAATEVGELEQLLSLSRGSHVVDLMCGIGRHSIELASRGYKVTGIDRHAQFLNRAKASATKAGVAVDFIQLDVRDLSVSNTFDAALVLWNTFGYFDTPEQDLQFLRRILESLRPGGQLLIQTLGKEHIARRFRRGGRDWFEKVGYLELIERRIIDNWSSEVTRVILIGPTGRKDLEFTCRLYSAVEMMRAFTEVGFREFHLHSSLSGAPYNAWTGQHDTHEGALVAVARKSP